MPDTGILDAMTAAGLSFGSPILAPGFSPLPLPQTAPIPEVIEASDCVCYIEKVPDPVTLDVQCQSACQRVTDPDVVELILMLKGQGTFSWDDTNSGFSVDGGATWYALDPDTGDSMASPLSGIVVDQERPFTMVLDMSTHIDDFLTGQDQVEYLVTFTT